MAKLKEMVGEKVVSGFRGVIDFYYWMGIPVARKWPRKRNLSHLPQVTKNWLAFSYAAHHWNTLPEETRQAYNDLATGTGLSGRDFFMRSFISGLFETG